MIRRCQSYTSADTGKGNEFKAVQRDDVEWTIDYITEGDLANVSGSDLAGRGPQGYSTVEVARRWILAKRFLDPQFAAEFYDANDIAALVKFDFSSRALFDVRGRFLRMSLLHQLHRSSP